VRNLAIVIGLGLLAAVVFTDAQDHSARSRTLIVALTDEP
jgi:hypothetical protein